MPPIGASLIQDLGIVVAGAAVASILFRRLRLPVIFGYLAMGLFLGSKIFPTPIIGDAEGIRQVSELGVMFLLFFMGLEFDLAKLRRVFTPALLAVAAQTVAMICLARLVAPLLGWGNVSSLFFGSLLAISSSMVTLRVIHDQGRANLPHAQLATGIMILEDVLAILLLGLLSGVGVSESFDWHALWLVTFLMEAFVVGFFYFGRLAAPRLVSLMQGEENREALTIISVGLILGIGALALKLHFSGALGAFVAGAILSKTKLVQDILNNNRSLRDLFCAVFFVTIGLQIDLHLVLSNIGWVLGLTVLMIVGKIASCYLGMFLAGQSPENSYNASASKAQIGEFSFIIVALGNQLGITSARERASLTAITFGIAFASILLTPVISSTSPKQFKWLAVHIPNQLGRFAKFYRNYLDTVQTVIGRNRLVKLIKTPLTQIVLYFFLVSAITLGGAFTARWVSHLRIETPMIWGLAVWASTAVLAVPFIIAMARNISTIIFMLTETVFAQYKAHALMQGRVSNLVNTLATLLLLLIMGGMFLSVASPYLPRGAAIVIFLCLIIGIGFFFWRKMVNINSRIEALFIESFSEDTHADEERRHAEYMEKLKRNYPWPAGVREVRLKADSRVCGKHIRELDLPRRTGSTIIAIVRGGLEAFDPSPDVPLFPDDLVVLLGSDACNERALALLDEKAKEPVSTTSNGTINIGHAILPCGSSLDGNTLAGSCLRRQFGVSVIGIQRGPLQITTPRADELLKAGDMILFVGIPARVDAFRKFLHDELMGAQAGDSLPPPNEMARKTD